MNERQRRVIAIASFVVAAIGALALFPETTGSALKYVADGLE